MSDIDEKNRLGKSFIFPKGVMDDIHIKSDLGRYRMRGFSLFKKDSNMGRFNFYARNFDALRY